MVVEFHQKEGKVILALKKAGGSSDIQRIIGSTKLAHSTVMRAILTLKKDGFVSLTEKSIKRLMLSEEGKRYAIQGLPERKLVNVLQRMGGEVDIDVLIEAASFDRKTSVIAIGWLNRKDWAKISKEDHKLIMLKEPAKGRDEELLEFLKKREVVQIDKLDENLRSIILTLKQRNLVLVQEEKFRMLLLTKKGKETASNGIKFVIDINQLTPELITTGKWRETTLHRYNIEAAVCNTWPGKKHPYLKFLDRLKNKLVALGFKEMTSPIVELSLFNCDALYLPQDHPAREIHDMCLVEEPKYGNLEQHKQILKNIHETHETGGNTGSKGWRYDFSDSEASRLLLRSHTTTASVRQLINSNLDIPGKYFSVARCFRPDVIDKTHLPEFNQVEGIIIGEDLSLVNLLGVLKKFAIELADADSVRFIPDYYPFTEPSVELQAYKEGLGWLEFGGSGVFRPEVVLPLGISVPVLAWGLGVDRLFMMKAGINDIRCLFSHDLEWLRRMEMV